ncbi:MAG: N-6 DNA methylase [Candidatus Marinimicrobia bacterium]|nr:N-6 DNA methylase [Candidatus Neomarinimicrobiota bacterium]
MGKKKKTEAQKEDILRIASFILLDAALFHEILAGVRKDINPISSLYKPLKNSLIKEWEKILKIDYESIFNIRLKIVQNLPSSPKIEFMLQEITSLTTKIASSGTYLRHDLMGRIYHKLLLRTTGGYYATYYTSIPAAVLLSNLIVKSYNPNLNWDFRNEENIKNLRIIDPACGSGTLLSAIYTVIRNEYLLHNEKAQLKKLHQILLEHTIYGLDILDYASHLTLTSLSLHNPKAVFDEANIYTLPIGVLAKDVYLGSLDFLRTEQQLTLIGKDWTLPFKRTGLTKEEEVYKPLNLESHSFDIVIMNPPFSRSAKPNLIFGFTTEEVKRLMTKELKRIAKEYKIQLQNGEEIDLKGIGQAGLGAYFIFIADKLLKNGGRLGLVIPRVLLSGVSWEKVRKLLYFNFEIEYIISNFDPGDRSLGIEGWNWSENTDLGEILIVARKTQMPLDSRKTAFINLHNKPGNAVESILISQQILNRRKELKETIKEGKYTTIDLGDKEIGFIYLMSQKDLDVNFLFPCLFSHPELNYLILELNDCLPIVQLSELLVSSGIDIKQIKDHFVKTDKSSVYKIYGGTSLH